MLAERSLRPFKWHRLQQQLSHSPAESRAHAVMHYSLVRSSANTAYKSSVPYRGTSRSRRSKSPLSRQGLHDRGHGIVEHSVWPSSSERPVPLHVSELTWMSDQDQSQFICPVTRIALLHARETRMTIRIYSLASSQYTPRPRNIRTSLHQHTLFYRCYCRLFLFTTGTELLIDVVLRPSSQLQCHCTLSAATVLLSLRPLPTLVIAHSRNSAVALCLQAYLRSHLRTPRPAQNVFRSFSSN